MMQQMDRSLEAAILFVITSHYFRCLSSHPSCVPEEDGGVGRVHGHVHCPVRRAQARGPLPHLRLDATASASCANK